jgi:hypothetical protein
MEYPNITLNFETYMELYNSYIELKQIKNLIEDNVSIDKNNKLEFESAYSFCTDLLKVIKYTDVKFYEDLTKYIKNKQQGAGQ